MNTRRSTRIAGLVAALLICKAVFAADDSTAKATAPSNAASEAALRRSIDEVRAGTPDYAQMSPTYGDAVRKQLPQMQYFYRNWGEIEKIVFKGADPTGGDFYEVTFEHGEAEFLITLSPDGKIVGEGVRPIGIQPLPAVAAAAPPPDAPKAQPGPYQVTAEPAYDAPGLKTFHPSNLEPFPKRDTLPVVLWGNGGCAMDVPAYAGFLGTIASHGFLVITTAGQAQEAGATRLARADDLKIAIDWVQREERRSGSPLRGKIDTKRIAVMGQSCGGGLAVTLGADPRVSTIGVFNFGVQPQNSPGPLPSAEVLRSLHGPVLFINGGQTDSMMGPSKVAYEAVDRLPTFYGSRHDAGHAATMFYPGGGEFANVAFKWLLWQFKHDCTAAAMFVGVQCGLCVNANWDVASKRLSK